MSTPPNSDMFFDSDEMAVTQRIAKITRGAWQVMEDEFGSEWVEKHVVLVTGIAKHPADEDHRKTGMGLTWAGHDVNILHLMASMIIRQGMEIEQKDKKMNQGEGIAMIYSVLGEVVEALASVQIVGHDDGEEDSTSEDE